jgi:hypothetical protein
LPSPQPLPSIPELLRAFEGEVAGRRVDADSHRGGIYDLLSGVGALIFRRQAERDASEFRRAYFSTAEDEALDVICEQRFGRSRVLGTAGVGTAVLVRATASAGAGTVLEGTRILVGSGGAAEPCWYRVTADTPMAATGLTVVAPVEAVEIGRGSFVHGTRNSLSVLRLEDPLWDASLYVDSITCGDGTEREEDHDLQAAVRQERVDARVGYSKAIERACREAGAAEVVLFPGNYLGDAVDYGLNRVYVADGSHETPAALLVACRKAIAGVAMGGAAVQVLPVTTVVLQLDLTIELWSAPSNPRALGEFAVAAAVEYFATRENPFVWQEAGVKGAVMRAIQGVRSITLTPSVAAPTLATLFSANPLPRYHVEACTVRASVEGPH